MPARPAGLPPASVPEPPLGELDELRELDPVPLPQPDWKSLPEWREPPVEEAPPPPEPEPEPEPRPVLRVEEGAGWFETFRTESWGFAPFASDWADVIFRPFEAAGGAAPLAGDDDAYRYGPASEA